MAQLRDTSRSRRRALLHCAAERTSPAHRDGRRQDDRAGRGRHDGAAGLQLGGVRRGACGSEMACTAACRCVGAAPSDAPPSSLGPMAAFESATPGQRGSTFHRAAPTVSRGAGAVPPALPPSGAPAAAIGRRCGRSMQQACATLGSCWAMDGARRAMLLRRRGRQGALCRHTLAAWQHRRQRSLHLHLLTLRQHPRLPTAAALHLLGRSCTRF